MMPTVSRTFQVGLCALLIILSLFREIGDEKVLVQNPPGYVPIVLRSLQYYLIMIIIWFTLIFGVLIKIAKDHFHYFSPLVGVGIRRTRSSEVPFYIHVDTDKKIHKNSMFSRIFSINFYNSTSSFILLLLLVPSC
jgi:hypothetical protein